MFAKLSTLALLLPFVSALTLNNPTGTLSPGQSTTFTWTGSTTDPATFSLQLVNPVFHNTFAVATNVMTAQGSVTIVLPQLPLDGNYQLQAIAVNDVNNVLSQTGTFSVVAASSTTGTETSTSTGTETASSSTGTHTSGSATTKASATSATGTGTASATPSTFSSGAASFKLVGVAPAAALVLSAVAGAAMLF